MSFSGFKNVVLSKVITRVNIKSSVQESCLKSGPHGRPPIGEWAMHGKISEMNK